VPLICAVACAQTLPQVTDDPTNPMKKAIQMRFIDPPSQVG
jgi:hypothetical protein